MAKNYPRCVFRHTLSLAMSGRAATRYARDEVVNLIGVAVGPLKQLVVMVNFMLYQPDLRQRLQML